MFDFIGEKIKKLAKVICWLGIISSVLLGFMIMSTEGDPLISTLLGLPMIDEEEIVIFGFLYMIIGSILSWISSFVLYGFGELIDTTMNISRTIDRKLDRLTLNRNTQSEVADGWKCAHCGKENSNVSSQCKGCGKYRS